MQTLEELRLKIDEADKELLRAFSRRLEIVKSIAQYKKENGQPVYDPDREQEKFVKLEKLADPAAKPYIRSLYGTIMDIAKDMEEKPVFAVLGKSLSHTYSPLIHSLITSDYTYVTAPREEDELEELWNLAKKGVYGGFNVTIPYKKTVLHMCDELYESAYLSGAVNTVVFDKEGRAKGANTDIFGFTYMLRSNGIDPEGKKVLVLGTGGASSAAAAALDKMKAASISFAGRSGDINYSNVYDRCADAQILINCTPVGMYPDIDAAPVDVRRFKNLEAVCDLIYNPATTRLLYDAQKQGIARTCSGLSMLVAQAFKSAAFFKGALSDEQAESAVYEDQVKRVIDILTYRMKNITIIGMPGSGKTWFARELSRHLDRELVDLDAVYTETYGRTPARAVMEDGEDAFREEEALIARQQLSRSGLVISCGGGIVVKEKNFFPIKCNSTVLYNDRPLEVLSMNNRPISVAKGPRALFDERKDAYESLADIRISVGAKDTREEYLEEALRIFDENIRN